MYTPRPSVAQLSNGPLLVALLCCLQACSLSPSATTVSEAPIFTTLSNDEVTDEVLAVFQESAPEVIRTRFAHVDMGYFDRRRDFRKDSVITLPLFDGLELPIRMDSVETAKDSVLIWHGTPMPPFYGTATLVTSAHDIIGTIQVHSTVYSITPVGEEIVRIREVDPLKFAQADNP
ncbi:MAG: hypothetical protein ABI599_02190 [Flavobacteriales bacterium]